MKGSMSFSALLRFELPTVVTPLIMNNGCCDDVVNMLPIAQENEL